MLLHACVGQWVVPLAKSPIVVNGSEQIYDVSGVDFALFYGYGLGGRCWLDRIG